MESKVIIITLLAFLIGVILFFGGITYVAYNTIGY